MERDFTELIAHVDRGEGRQRTAQRMARDLEYAALGGPLLVRGLAKVGPFSFERLALTGVALLHLRQCLRESTAG